MAPRISTTTGSGLARRTMAGSGARGYRSGGRRIATAAGSGSIGMGGTGSATIPGVGLLITMVDGSISRIMAGAGGQGVCGPAITGALALWHSSGGVEAATTALDSAVWDGFHWAPTRLIIAGTG